MGIVFGAITIATAGGFGIIKGIGKKVAKELVETVAKQAAEQLAKDAAESIAKETAEKLFRAVHKTELDDILEFGFRNKSGYETGKLFATNFEDAINFGRLNYKLDKTAFHIIESSFPSYMEHLLFKGEMDAMKAISVPTELLNKLPINNIFDYLKITSHPFIKF
jgi:hypothetical protein